MSRLVNHTERSTDARPVVYTHREVIRNEWQECNRFLDELTAIVRGFEFADDDIFGISTAVGEALDNAVKHGNCCDDECEIVIESSVTFAGIRIRITDEGNGFDPKSVPDPTLAENMDRTHGRGLLIMRHFMTGLRFRDNGRTVEMWRERNGFV